MKKKFIGFFLIFFALLLLLSRTNIAPIESFLSWSFLLFFLGALLVLIGFIKENAQLVLFASLASTLGLFIWGIEYVEKWSDHWSILIILFGINFFLQFLLNKNNMTLVVAIILILSGVSAWPGLGEIEAFSSIAPILNTYWPILILGLGLYFLMRKE